MNEKIKELIDWCQEEIDFCIDIMNPEHGYNSYHTHRAEAKKQVLDTVKDKLCSIYEDNIMTKVEYVVAMTNRTEEELINKFCPTNFNIPINISKLTICDGEYCDECIKCWNEEMCGHYSVVRQMNRDEATNEGDLAYCDDFLCSKCGIHLTDWFRIDAKEDDCYEYEFKFCPNCGAKIANHD